MQRTDKGQGASSWHRHSEVQLLTLPQCISTVDAYTRACIALPDWYALCGWWQRCGT